MRIACSNSVEQVSDFVGLVVAVGVSQEQNAWFVDDQHAVFVEFKTRRADKLVVERSALVRFAIVVGVFQDQQAVAGSSRIGQPLWIVDHAGNPQSSLVVETDLRWIGEFRKVFFGSKHFDFKAFRDFHLRD